MKKLFALSLFVLAFIALSVSAAVSPSQKPVSPTAFAAGGHAAVPAAPLARPSQKPAAVKSVE